MRNWPNVRVEKYRWDHQVLGSGGRGYGCFLIPTRALGRVDKIKVIFSDGTGVEDQTDEIWEHASVSLDDRTPTWDEMCLVKHLFWKDDECVFQYHPAKADYISDHPYTLHLWRKVGFEPPMPPKWMV